MCKLKMARWPVAKHGRDSTRETSVFGAVGTVSGAHYGQLPETICLSVAPVCLSKSLKFKILAVPS